MLNFKKVLNLNIILIIITSTFCINSAVYGIGLSSKSHLRTPSLGNSEEGKKRLSETLDEEINTPKIVSIQNLCDSQPFVGIKDDEKRGIFVASPTKLILQIMRYIKYMNPNAKICDIGSGNGKFCFIASQYFYSVTGIEWSKARYKKAISNQNKLGDLPGINNVRFKYGDFLKEDLLGYDFLYFFYTTPQDIYKTDEEFHRALREKMVSRTGLKPGARLIIFGLGQKIADDKELSYSEVNTGSYILSVYTRSKVEKLQNISDKLSKKDALSSSI